MIDKDFFFKALMAKYSPAELLDYHIEISDSDFCDRFHDELLGSQELLDDIFGRDQGLEAEED